MLFSLFLKQQANDDDFLIDQELVDRINNDPQSSFTAFLNPKWASKKVKDAKKFLSPVRQSPVSHGSARPVGYTEKLFYHMDKRFLSGTCSDYQTYNQGEPSFQGPIVHKLCGEFDASSSTITNSAAGVESGTVYFPVYDVEKLCSSWAPAVTSAMTSALYRWTPKKSNPVFNLSLLFVLDCDILGDPCVERPPLAAYEQFWRRYIPPQGNWDSAEKRIVENEQDKSFLRTPSNSLTQDQCSLYNGCYPGITPSTGGPSCARKMVLTGICQPGTNDQACPIYFLYNWRWMKSHIAEVGPITSSILVYPSLFTYSAKETDLTKNVYSSGSASGTSPLGMLDVTIIGWGQTKINLSADASSTAAQNRWWYVIPHFGQTYTVAPSGTTVTSQASLPCSHFTQSITGTAPDKEDPAWAAGAIFQFNNVQCKNGQTPDAETGVIKFNRRFDDCNIESQSIGAVPHNFVPKPFRSPRPTWSGVWEAIDM